MAHAPLAGGSANRPVHVHVHVDCDVLERTEASVEQIAASCGMGTSATLRRHVHRAVGASPTAYRATFRLA